MIVTLLYCCPLYDHGLRITNRTAWLEAMQIARDHSHKAKGNRQHIMLMVVHAALHCTSCHSMQHASSTAAKLAAVLPAGG
jgi:hypothetical protein